MQQIVIDIKIKLMARDNISTDQILEALGLRGSLMEP